MEEYKGIEELTDKSLEKFIKENPENYKTEYKEINDFKKENKKSILRTVCAFANSNSKGRLLLGVSDDYRIKGIPGDTNEEKIADSIRNNIVPVPFFKIRTFYIEHKKVVCIDVLEDKKIPYSLEGVFYKRIGHSSCVIKDYREIKALEDNTYQEAINWLNLSGVKDFRFHILTYPNYIDFKNWEREVRDRFSKINEKYKLKMISVKTWLIDLSDIKVEIDAVKYEVRMIVPLKVENNHSFQYNRAKEEFLNICEILYGGDLDKEMVFLANTLMPDETDEININKIKMYRGMNYLIEEVSGDAYERCRYLYDFLLDENSFTFNKGVLANK